MAYVCTGTPYTENGVVRRSREALTEDFVDNFRRALGGLGWTGDRVEVGAHRLDGTVLVAGDRIAGTARVLMQRFSLPGASNTRCCECAATRRTWMRAPSPRTTRPLSDYLESCYTPKARIRASRP
jgi:hypothetical protein